MLLVLRRAILRRSARMRLVLRRLIRLKGNLRGNPICFTVDRNNLAESILAVQKLREQVCRQGYNVWSLDGFAFCVTVVICRSELQDVATFCELHLCRVPNKRS